MLKYAYLCVSGCFLKPEKDDGFPGAKVANMWVLRTDLGHLQEKEVLLFHFLRLQ